MHYYRGISALSGFRLNKYLASIRMLVPSICKAHAEYVHFVILMEEPDKSEQELLHGLLHYGHPAGAVDGQVQLLVTPRPGTISPWSSKATDIAWNCGLGKVKRIERGTVWHLDTEKGKKLQSHEIDQIKPLLHDRMTETVFDELHEAEKLFIPEDPRPLAYIELLEEGFAALELANERMGMALSKAELEYLANAYREIGRNPTDVELMMFAQANSEHCRHKIFNATWQIDGTAVQESLFDNIRATHEQNPGHVLSAYSDNAAVITGYQASRFFPDPLSRQYTIKKEDVHILMKVETHNHPTAISPFPGASTGSGGEIRDEAATGRGAKPKAGLTGFSVSNLQIPEAIQPWEQDYGKPGRIASALDIMLEGPLGGAAFNNEFGRPALCGYFRTYEQIDPEGTVRGYHKPVMLAGGYGMIREQHIHKHEIPSGASLVVLGGPAMLIGLGGGAASSMASGASDADLDYASVQRDNPEMQRRCQEVIDACWSMGAANPILSIHDVGAGGLSNALPELVSASHRGAILGLRKIPNAEPGMSPMEIWCNEAQERYVLAIARDALSGFEELCRRERAPYAVLGEATAEPRLLLQDEQFNNTPIDIPVSLLLGKLPRMQRSITGMQGITDPPGELTVDIPDAVDRLLHLPTIADKRFLITIGDRSVSGLVARDQMIGPWQTPVADCAITCSAIDAWVGEAMAIGERTPIAVLDGPASGRMAVGEAITNITAARILKPGDISLSANWMAACNGNNEDASLYKTVKAVSEFCQQFGICIPVGKDSLSMNTVWQEGDQQKQVTAPVSLVVSAFAPVADIRQQLTPLLDTNVPDSVLVLIDLGRGRHRTGGSSLHQVYNRVGDAVPDIEHADDLVQFFTGIQVMNEMGVLLAYHDRSDGGLFITLCEMAFASRSGLNITLDNIRGDTVPVLFCEELGAVIQVRREDIETVVRVFEGSGISDHIHVIGELNGDKNIKITRQGQSVFSSPVLELHRKWSETTFRMQSLRDNPECARQEYDALLDEDDPGLSVSIPEAGVKRSPEISTRAKPRIAILREQGVNGQVEMAAAFHRAGFVCIDVHMHDIKQDPSLLESFHGMAACGGFSYGDVLGAGGGWAKSILYNEPVREAFHNFFHRTDTFGLGVCNGCQMMANLKELLPGASHWPRFIRNSSEQFESRLVMVEVLESSSLLLQGMEGLRIPIVVAHGEGQAVMDDGSPVPDEHAVLRYLDHYGKPTDQYPLNPNGSVGGLNGFTSSDGRFTIMMPHPERVFLRKQYSWFPGDWTSEESPWMQLFQNARAWLD